jgi:5'-3' exonuclease
MILIDGDIVAYRCAFKCNDESEGSACYTTGSFLSDLISDLFTKIDGEPDYRVFLTGKGNFRHDIAVTAPYKGNRKEKEKPVHLEAIRQYLINDWNAEVSEGEEADDAIAIAATAESIIVSLDKDFKQVPCRHYNYNKQELTTVSESEGTLFFYQQIIMGDRADNIIGVHGIGEKKSLKLLEGLSEIEMYKKCVELLESEERVIENARLLWLRREPNQMWEPPSEEKQEEHTEGV